jgi:ABC-type dipeptide/oligopeptide/nickel transport system permease component
LKRMDEYSSGMDPEMRRHFRKIMNSFSLGLLWLLCMVTLGLFLGLGMVSHGVKWYSVVFYVFAVASLAWLVRWFYRTWREDN